MVLKGPKVYLLATHALAQSLADEVLSESPLFGVVASAILLDIIVGADGGGGSGGVVVILIMVTILHGSRVVRYS